MANRGVERPESKFALLRQQGFIDGVWVDADDGATIPVENPANGKLLGTAPRMGRAETNRAIAAAHKAFNGWRARTAGQRATVLRAWFELIKAHQEELARLLTAEQGKPLSEARGEIAYAAGFIEWFAEEAKRLYGDVIPAHQADKRILVLKQPIGVVAAITPWNFPAAMVTRKLGPALAAGCTVVLKPASQTPYTAFAIADLAAEAGIPPGALNVVTGPAQDIAAELTANPLVRKLSFTGSTEIGKILMAQCSATMKKVSLELGGNAPFIVFDDADLDAAVDGAIVSKFRNTGQTCVCANRLLAQDGIYEAFVEKLAARVSALNVGDGLTEVSDQGPMIDERAIAKVEEHIADAVKKGARTVTGGRRHALGGRFFEPTVLRDATADMLIAKEETFGPVAAVFRFHDDRQAVEMANNTDAGLASYFYTRDIKRLFATAEALEYGIVGANTGLISTEVAPFGGIKESGVGREGSKYGIEDYVEIKYVCVGGL